MSEQRTKTTQEVEAERKRTEELERRAQAEGIATDHPEGKERFEELVRRAARQKR